MKWDRLAIRYHFRAALIEERHAWQGMPLAVDGRARARLQAVEKTTAERVEFDEEARL